jgi:holo-[acyl-carrier protein] synthase
VSRLSVPDRACCEVAVGVDLVSVDRFGRLLRDHPGAAADLFTAVELAACAGKRRRTEHLAARFAAKEAVLKALGSGLGPGMRWTDIEVTNDPQGRPLADLRGAVAERARSCGFRQVCLSLTHTAGLAMAEAAAVRGNNADVSWLAGDAGTKAMVFNALSSD